MAPNDDQLLDHYISLYRISVSGAVYGKYGFDAQTASRAGDGNGCPAFNISAVCWNGINPAQS
jgi:hypothetical protein